VRTALDAVRECVGDEGEEVAGVGIASMAESGVPLDAERRPLSEVIAWFDRRSAPQAAQLDRDIGARELFAITGLPLDAKYTLPKLMWLREQRPAEMRRMHAWAGVADLLALRLTGALGTDASLACRSLAFDVGTRRWRPDLLALAGLSVEQMPAVVMAGTPVGEVTSAAASESGLRAGTPVCVAGHDHLVGALGAGVADPGHAADSMGSAEVGVVVLDEPSLTDAAFADGLASGCHAASDRSYLLGSLPSSGTLLEWFAATFAGGRSMPDLLEAASLPSGIVARPFVRGRGAPDPDPAATGSLAQLRTEHGVAAMALGLVEGTAYQLRRILETLATVSGQPIADVTLFGGGAGIAAWRRVKANVNPWPTLMAATTEATALGAALLGARAAGHAPTSIDTARLVPQQSALAAAYDDLYRTRYLPLRNASFWPDVADVSGLSPAP
jgi:xylulokinase